MTEFASLDDYSHCTLCPRRCGANRLAGQAGFCRQTAELRIGAIVAHRGEEPCITGTHGSGTIFFTGCTCGCFFCQNHQLSQLNIGRAYDEDSLHSAVLDLIAQGVHNLNFVTPEHWWPHIRRLCQWLRQQDFWLPTLWNSSGYFSPERLREQVELIDIFLPDFKYADPELARRCMGDPRYPQLALDGIRLLAERIGNLRPYDPSGDLTATRGLMVRHLVLPGQLDNSLRVLDLLAQHIGTDLPISLMSQFMPVPACHERQFLTRKVTEDEYAAVCDHADELGFTKVFTQYDNGEDAYLPDFTQPQPFAALRQG